MEDVLQRIILENQKLISGKNLLSRGYSIPETDNISVLVGIRRCGKTYTLYEIAKKFDPEKILFFDFEDERLLPLNSLSSYDIIIDSYKTLFPDKKPILFFDEIQNLKNWHLYLKRLHAKEYKIYVTGSNAHLISREIATYLKGRSLETTIYPFSFSEFLRMKDVRVEKKDTIINRPSIIHQFEEYMQYGGFPEVIKAGMDEKRATAKNIYNLLFYKDLVSRFDKDDYLLKLVVNKVVENITNEFSVASLAKRIRSLYKTTIPTVTDYFNILPEPFLSSNIYPYRNSFIRRELKRKTYLADNSFIFLNRITFDKSRLFENLVFNYLQRNHPDIYYYKTKSGKEVDFFVSQPNGSELIQASYSINDMTTREREIKSLAAAMEELKVETGTIYTNNSSEEVQIGSRKIQIIPFWEKMLEGK